MLEVFNLFRSYRTILELLSDRNYHIPDEFKNVNSDTFMIMYNNKNIDLFVNNGEEDYMYVKFFTDVSGFRKKNLLDLCDKMQEITDRSVKLIIVFMNNKLPSNATRKDLANSIFHSQELFKMKELLFNITHNFLVPRHILVTSEEEITTMLQFYDCTIKQLPKIRHTDPAARYYGFKIGDICKIIRPSKITGESLYYRRVI